MTLRVADTLATHFLKLPLADEQVFPTCVKCVCVLNTQQMKVVCVRVVVLVNSTFMSLFSSVILVLQLFFLSFFFLVPKAAA